MLPDPPTSYAARWADERQSPQKFRDPYAYDLVWHDKIWQGKFTKHLSRQQKHGSFDPDRMPSAQYLNKDGCVNQL